MPDRSPVGDDRLLTPPEVGALIGLSGDAVREMAHDGVLPHQVVERDGGRRPLVRFSRDDVAAMGTGRPAAEIANSKNWRAVYAGERSPGMDMWVRPRPGSGAVGAPSILLVDVGSAAADVRDAQTRLASAQRRESPRLAAAERRAALTGERWATAVHAAVEAGWPVTAVAAVSAVSPREVRDQLDRTAAAGAGRRRGRGDRR